MSAEHPGDDWNPTDDPDEWEPDGQRRGDPTEDRLRWRAITPAGMVIDMGGDGRPFMTRRDALAFAFAPGFEMSQATFDGLLELTHSVAGWAAIECLGWKIEPVDAGSPISPHRDNYCPRCGMLWDWIDRNAGEHGSACNPGVPIVRR